MMTKKELLQEYKQKVFRMGVFQIRNTVNNKILVESSPNLDAIWNRHRLELKFGSHRNLVLQADWAAHGEENFVYEILEELNQTQAAANKLDPAKEIKLLEQLYLDELQPFEEKGYNRKSK
jgi:3-deoxy-D-manno-octulosonic-acid transferase